MTVQVQNLIYAPHDRHYAEQILQSLQRDKPEENWDMVSVDGRYQLVKVTKCPAYMPPAKPAPIKDITISDTAIDVNASDAIESIEVSYPYWGETPGSVYVLLNDVRHYIYKCHFVSYQVAEDKSTVTIKLPKVKTDKFFAFPGPNKAVKVAETV